MNSNLDFLSSEKKKFVRGVTSGERYKKNFYRSVYEVISVRMLIRAKIIIKNKKRLNSKSQHEVVQPAIQRTEFARRFRFGTGRDF